MLFMVLLVVSSACIDKDSKQKTLENTTQEYYAETYRPQFHFTPEEKWMNDPNGMVYNKGVYHLFYQYYPDSIVWGPMHWGHATSEDLVHWNHKPIALYPDKLGYIFSGSAVLDKDNTSGFGTDENPPLVAIYTYHDMDGEKAGRTDYQTQGIAYSLDNGDTWTKYADNPVIGNTDIKDFRDPKVMWHEDSQAWIMSLVAGDYAQFYSSQDLKTWKLTGEFGKDVGAHGGVWECPDLFKLEVEDSEEEKWVLFISINPGGPNGGSSTQYFIGDFDGKTFTTDQVAHKWLDWGTDNYAGVTYSNEPNGDRIFIGWMSNWLYGQETPTEKWRSAMTVPRKLSLRKVGNGYDLINYPVSNIEKIIKKEEKKNVTVVAGEKETVSSDHLMQSDLRFTTQSKDFRIKFRNSLGEEVVLSMLEEEKEFLLDRTNSGKSDFQEDFASVQKMPIPSLPEETYEVRILMDHSSIEVFINEGQYVMTAQLFPNEFYTDVVLENTSERGIVFKDFEIGEVQRIW
ncbi:MAG: glycosyl hydrolase family 32 [Flavobacteriaceae bacterium]|nr:MAG: glycosyl hydrolase family 32 [Flavobacteriaceae bacterium]